MGSFKPLCKFYGAAFFCFKILTDRTFLSKAKSITSFTPKKHKSRKGKKEKGSAKLGSPYFSIGHFTETVTREKLSDQAIQSLHPFHWIG